MSQDLLGQRLGKYRIESEIGRGGMGTVFKAYDPTLDRYAALKVLAPHLAWKEEAIERFLREARAAARLKHSSIITIYDVGQQEDQYYFAMEYLEGRSLTEVLRDRGPLPCQEALAILRPLAAALDYAHNEGLVHRDIKPSNIVVGPQGQVTLTDFGIVHAAQQTRLTATGTLVGTPEYMSPEQAKGATVDARSDQYSLAVVAYEMLGGRVPFSADSPYALLYKVTQEPLPPIREARPDLPAEVEQVLAKALAKEPSDRYATVSAFVESLERAIAREAEPAVPPAPAAPWTEAPTILRQPDTRVPPRRQLSQPTRNIPLWAWAVGGLAVVGLVVGLVKGLSGTNLSSAPTQTVEPPAVVASATVQVAAVETSAASSTPAPTTAPTTAPSPSPTNTPLPTPTSTPTPMPTPTATPAPTETPQPRPSATPEPGPSATTIPRAVAPELTAPAQGGTYQSPVTFQWTGSLNTGQSYRVTAYHTESGHALQSGPVAAESWEAELPADKFGEWRWSVSVVQDGDVAAQSPEWTFWFDPHPGGDGPQATPTR